MSVNYLEKLKELIAILRDPHKGCPWDIQQTHQSLIPFLKEETWELADELEKLTNNSRVIDELGDVLFQVLIHCQIAKENQRFTLEDVMKNLADKLIRRHPHVFDKTFKRTFDGDVHQLWAKIKNTENLVKKHPYEKIPSNAPAFFQTEKICDYASKKNFDWENPNQVLEKLLEEVEELQNTWKEENKANIEEEIGDILFTMSNLCRHLGLDAEKALKKSNQKFIARFLRLEAELEKREQQTSSGEDLNKIWNTVKEQIKNTEEKSD